MTDHYNFCIGTEFSSFCLKSFHLCCLTLLRVFLLRRQFWPSDLVRERAIVLFVSDLRHGFRRPVHDWSFMSLRSNIVHLISTENILPPSYQRRLSFLFDRSFCTLKFRVFIVWSTWSLTDVFFLIFHNSVFHCFWHFLGRTKPRQSESEQNPAIFQNHISLADNKAWSHRMSKSWASSFCNRTLNKSESPCTAS